MRFLVDECVGISVVEWLENNNYDVFSVQDELQSASDKLILNKALLESRIIITCDKDFGEMIFKEKKEHFGIILLRLLDERPLNKIKILEQILINHFDNLEGNFTVATESSIRITKAKINFN
jgi:predicted nuclease of predicted toxin-antitoxin system